jgi:isopropylmalate/homocitrate/citramalate synthase
MKNSIWLVDSTFREGEQAAGFSPSIETKLAIARGIDALGCDMIEVGHPAVAPCIEEFAQRISSINIKAQTLAHSLLNEKSIRQVAELGIDWIGFFLCIRPEAKETKYGNRFNSLYQSIRDHVLLAHELGLKVRFSCEDASRTGRNLLIDFYQKLLNDGVDLIGYADTAGCLLPNDASQIFKELRKRFPNTKLHFHGHNDRGMALANVLAAYQAGWNSADASVLGLGERMGIASLTEAAIVVNEQFQKHLNIHHCQTLEELAWSCLDVAAFRRRRFSHKAGLHGSVVLKQPEMYESVSPGKMGSLRQVGLSRYSGAHAVQEVARSLHIFLNDDQAKEISLLLKQDCKEYWSQGSIRAYLTGALHTLEESIQPILNF